jgi:hypothetical protein
MNWSTKRRCRSPGCNVPPIRLSPTSLIDCALAGIKDWAESNGIELEPLDD